MCPLKIKLVLCLRNRYAALTSFPSSVTSRGHDIRLRVERLNSRIDIQYWLPEDVRDDLSLCVTSSQTLKDFLGQSTYWKREVSFIYHSKRLKVALLACVIRPPSLFHRWRSQCLCTSFHQAQRQVSGGYSLLFVTTRWRLAFHKYVRWKRNPQASCHLPGSWIPYSVICLQMACTWASRDEDRTAQPQLDDTNINSVFVKLES